MDAAVECLVNQERLKFGLPPLTPSDKLDTSAQNWNDHMVGTGDFSHGSDQAFSDRLLAVGYNWGEGGENIATGYMTPRDAVAGWMGSQEHCQNLLEPDFTNMGTGETPAPVGNFAGTPATWTQDFGTLMGQSSPSQNYGPMNGCPYTVASSPDPSSASSSGSGDGGSGSSSSGSGSSQSGTPTGPTGPTGPTATHRSHRPDRLHRHHRTHGSDRNDRSHGSHGSTGPTGPTGYSSARYAGRPVLSASLTSA